MRLRLDPRFHVELIDGDCLLVDEDCSTRLTGRILTKLAPSFGLGRTADELVDELAGQLDAVEVYFGVEQLRREGLLTPAVEIPDEAAYWTAHGRRPQPAQAAHRRSAVQLRAVGGVDLMPLQDALDRSGVSRGDGGLCLVLVDDYLRPSLLDVDREMRAAGRPWLPCRLRGRETWIGPLLRPPGDESDHPCWACVDYRLRGRKSLMMALREQRDAPDFVWPARARADFAVAAGASLVSAQVVSILVDLAAETAGATRALLTFDPVMATVRRHGVRRRPQCPCCGVPSLVAERQRQPVVLRSRLKAFTADGGHRVLDPTETVARHADLISPITGLVPHLETIALDTPGAAELIALVDSGSNQARSASTLADVRLGFRQRNGGKGSTVHQARASGLCEAIERHSGIWHGDELEILGRLDELDERVLSPAEWLGFSEAQYAAREAHNARHPDHFVHVPKRFDPAQRVSWTPAWVPATGECRLLPTALCYYGYPIPEHERFGRADSNGTAAGNCLEEAILQAVLEVVERDAVSLWWYNRVRRPAIALGDFALPYVERARAFHDDLGRDLWAIDLTTDLGIPVIAAFSGLREARGGTEQIMLGFGAHLDPRIALLRAVTELHQLLPSVERFEAGTLSSSYGATAWLGRATVEREPHLLAHAATPRGVSDWDTHWSNDVRDDVQACIQRLERRGLELLVLDQTRPDVGLSVARVVVPGLRHFWPRFAPGRLYDVPVELGWLDQPTAEADLNPMPMFF